MAALREGEVRFIDIWIDFGETGLLDILAPGKRPPASRDRVNSRSISLSPRASSLMSSKSACARAPEADFSREVHQATGLHHLSWYTNQGTF